VPGVPDGLELDVVAQVDHRARDRTLPLLQAQRLLFAHGPADGRKGAASSRSIAEYEQEFGWREVEEFLDAVMCVEEHFDPTSPAFRRHGNAPISNADRRRNARGDGQRTTDYDDLEDHGRGRCSQAQSA
jgi:hypothetical protein